MVPPQMSGLLGNRRTPDDATASVVPESGVAGGTMAAMSLSPRLAAVVAALPVRPDSRVLEIGCGPGAAARAVCRRVPEGHVLATDRSARALAQAAWACAAELATGRLELRRVAAEELVLAPGEAAYDLVFACRVGALDGRDPRAGRRALSRIAAVLAPGGVLVVDGREVSLPPAGG